MTICILHSYTIKSISSKQTKGLLTPWTMKLSHRHVIGCWTRPKTTSVYTTKNYQSDHEVRGPRKTYFKAYITHPHGPWVLRWERQNTCSSFFFKRQRPVTKKYYYNKIPIKCFGTKKMEKKDDKKNGQIGFYLVFFSKLPFLSI